MSRDEVKMLSDQLADLAEMVKAHIDKSDKHIEEDIKWKKDMEPIFQAIPELTGVIEVVKTSKSNLSFLSWVASKWKEGVILGGGIWAIIKFIGSLK